MAVSPDRAREKTQLARFRDIADRLMGDDWEIDVDGSATRIIAKRSTGEAVALCTIHADALASELELLSSGLVLLRLFLSLQDRAAATVLDLRGQLEGRARADRRKPGRRDPLRQTDVSSFPGRARGRRSGPLGR